MKVFKLSGLILCCFFTLASAMEKETNEQQINNLVKKTLALKFEYRGEELRREVEDSSRGFTFSEEELRKWLKMNCYKFSEAAPTLQVNCVRVSLSNSDKSIKDSILGAACMPLELEYQSAIPEHRFKYRYESDSPDIVEQKLFAFQKYGYSYALCDWSTSTCLGSDLCLAHPFTRWFEETNIQTSGLVYSFDVKGFFSPQKLEKLLDRPYHPIAYGEDTKINRRQYYVDLVRYLDSNFYEANKSFKDTENCRSDWHDCYECRDCLRSGYDKELDFQKIKQEAGSDYLLNYLEEYKECWSEHTKRRLEDILTKREYESIFGKDSVEEEKSLSGSSGSIRQALTAKSRKEDHNKMVKEKRSQVMGERKPESNEGSEQSESD